MASYDTIPSTAKTQPTPFKVNIPQEKLHQLEQLVKLSPIGPETYENLFEDRKLGVSRSWLESAKKEWESFDWCVTQTASPLLHTPPPHIRRSTDGASKRKSF